jgi:hypothetical protein
MSLSHIASVLLSALLFILWFLLGTPTKTGNISVQQIRPVGGLSRSRHSLSCR